MQNINSGPVIRTDIRKIKRQKCLNHPDKSAVRFCDRCDEPFCKECINEYWSHNFLGYAYLGEQKDFRKEYLCEDCERIKRRKGLYLSSSILIILSIAIMAFIYIR